MWMPPWHLDAHTLHPGYDGPSVDASPQLEPLVRPVGDNKLVDVGLISDHQHYFFIVQFIFAFLDVECKPSNVGDMMISIKWGQT